MIESTLHILGYIPSPSEKLLPAVANALAENGEVCVIIPTYNNAATLSSVIAAVAAFTKNIIVVNDGSTDNTQSIIDSFPFVQSISYAKNTGKGWALRKGFEAGYNYGYKYAITIDSDGQHFASDLPVFINKLLECKKDTIIIGARNMNQDAVPGGSSFGYKFSNFWFRLETGIHCPDTQSGYRLYPLLPLHTMHFYTHKYEFEIEVLVRSAWKGMDVEPVPVSVYYPPKETRVSHFRPYIDFARISVLNTILVLITYIYIKPRNFIRNLFTKGHFRQVLNEHLFSPHHSDQVKATSVAFGIFMGIIPIWGFQLVSAIFLSILLKLNKPIVIVAANISVPPMIPVLVFLSYKMGAFWMGDRALDVKFDRSISLSSISQNLQQYIYGSITLAVIAGAVLGLLTFIFLKLFHKKSVLAR